MNATRETLGSEDQAHALEVDTQMVGPQKRAGHTSPEPARGLAAGPKA